MGWLEEGSKGIGQAELQQNSVDSYVWLVENLDWDVTAFSPREPRAQPMRESVAPGGLTDHNMILIAEHSYPATLGCVALAVMPSAFGMMVRHPNGARVPAYCDPMGSPGGSDSSAVTPDVDKG